MADLRRIYAARELWTGIPCDLRFANKPQVEGFEQPCSYLVRLNDRSIAMRSSLFLLLATSALAVAIPAQNKQDQHPSAGSDQGLGWVHMDISCAPSAAAEFERALALLQQLLVYARAGAIRSGPKE